MRRALPLSLLCLAGAGAMLLPQQAAAQAAEAEDCPVVDVRQALEVSDGCVTIEAWDVDGLLMDDPLHRYAREARYSEPSSSGMLLGVDGGAYRPQGVAEALRVRLTGRVTSCAAQAGGNLLPSVEGTAFCDRYRGLYLQVSGAKLIEAQPLVRATAAMMPDGGNLQPLEAGALRDQIRLYFRSLLQAHRQSGGDMASLPEDAAVEIFGWRKPIWADAEAQAAYQQAGDDAPEAVACALNSADAAKGLWPISTKDIGMAAGRPYICSRIISQQGQLRAIFANDPSPAREAR